MERRRVFSLFDLAMKCGDEREASVKVAASKAGRARGLNLKKPALFAVSIYKDRQGRLCVALHPTEEIVRHARPFGYAALLPDGRVLPLTEEDYRHLCDEDRATWKDPDDYDGSDSCFGLM